MVQHKHLCICQNVSYDSRFRVKILESPETKKICLDVPKQKGSQGSLATEFLKRFGRI